MRGQKQTNIGIIPEWVEDADNGLTFLFRQLLQGLWGDLYALDQRMTELDKQIAVVAHG